MTPQTEMMFLLDRLARVHAAQRRMEGLTDAQIAALDYLSRANRFSRSPSVVAEYLATTRGTASQTLKALAEKGLIIECASTGDKRQRLYDLTEAGRAIVVRLPGQLPLEQEPEALVAAARLILRSRVSSGSLPPFGFCRTCRYHLGRDGQGAYCQLLKLDLSVEERDQLCHEYLEPV
jgi:DNA-binding MarR family transcriptional regulator